ncbi:MAG: hypothetical protein SWO11_22540 [Thermodesulfobacteriota bacterium]|nr:hypothetical protein [Thermodesulfobacteriota bacterium]
MIRIFLDTALAYVFPEAKLENPDEFYRYISEQYSTNITKTWGLDKTRSLHNVFSKGETAKQKSKACFRLFKTRPMKFKNKMASHLINIDS